MRGDIGYALCSAIALRFCQLGSALVFTLLLERAQPVDFVAVFNSACDVVHPTAE